MSIYITGETRKEFIRNRKKKKKRNEFMKFPDVLPNSDTLLTKV